jgi:hypothetical protein
MRYKYNRAIVANLPLGVGSRPRSLEGDKDAPVVLGGGEALSSESPNLLLTPNGMSLVPDNRVST